ncbi:MAG TPA: hypothetical protein VFQ35_21390 [Polyangiaceae bacterium]|nr:hypothetical protein [Polyangiaceae bacterium]
MRLAARAERLVIGLACYAVLRCVLGCSGQDYYPNVGVGGSSGGAPGAGGASGGAPTGANGGITGSSGAPSGGVSASSGGASGGTDAGTGGCANTGVYRTETMSPGVDCSGCHVFKVSGTVYPRGDVPSFCDGTPSISIEVTGSDGEVVTLVSNRVGNFESDRPLSPPYGVVVRSGNATRTPTHVTAGNCNGCHTSADTGPGRILAP